MAIGDKNVLRVGKKTHINTRVQSAECRLRIDDHRRRRNDKKELKEENRRDRVYARSLLSPEQQLKILDRRLGVGLGAKKERMRLQKELQQAQVTPIALADQPKVEEVKLSSEEKKNIKKAEKERRRVLAMRKDN